MSTFIHPTAIVEKGATLGVGCHIGPYCVIGPEVTLGAGVKLHSHVVVAGRTRIGDTTQIYPFASIGHPPQDLKFKNEPSTLTIGARNLIREHVTMNPGTEGGGMKTVVGDDCLFMMGAHVAHDCRVGNRVIMANNATLGGHVEVGDHTVIGGLAAVHQFVRVGAHAIIGGVSAVVHDVIPYGSVVADRAYLAGLNLVGLKRRGFDRDVIHGLRNAYKLIFEEESGTLAERTHWAREQYGHIPQVMEILSFISEKGSRSLCVPRQRETEPAE